VESSWDMRARVRPLEEGAVVQLEVRRKSLDAGRRPLLTSFFGPL
jgi:hypothetical protein